MHLESLVDDTGAVLCFDGSVLRNATALDVAVSPLVRDNGMAESVQPLVSSSLWTQDERELYEFLSGEALAAIKDPYLQQVTVDTGPLQTGQSASSSGNALNLAEDGT